MSENNYGALMLKSALAVTVDLTKITAPGLYPVDAGNATAPESSGGCLIVTTASVAFITTSANQYIKDSSGKWSVQALPLVKANLNIDLNTLGKPSDAGLYQQQSNANATTANNYPANHAGSLFVTPSAYGCQQLYITYSNRIFVRALVGNFTGNSPWNDWLEFFSTNGGTLAGNLTIAKSVPTMFLKSLDDDTRQYIMAQKKDGAGASWYVGKANAGSESCMLWNYSGNAGMEVGGDGRILLRRNGKDIIFQPDGTISGEVIGNNANNFRIAYGDYGAFWRQDGNNLYLMLTDSGDPLGSYNSLRPLQINMATGNVIIGRPLGVSQGITAGYTGTFAWADQYNTTAPYYHDFTSAGSSEYHPLIKQRARLSSNAWAFSMGVLVAGTDLSWNLHLKGSGSQDINHKWDTSGNYLCPGQVIPANYTNFDARYYTKAQSDAGYMPRTGAYTKAESDARFQLINTASRATNGWFKDTNTGMITQWGTMGSTGNSSFGITFPIAFPNVCLNLSATRISTSDSPTVSVNSVSRTGATIRQADGGNGGSYWVAVGY